MPKASVDKLVENITEVAYPKSSLILEAGKDGEKHFSSSEKGIVRAYVEAKGKEITFWIGAEGATVVSLKSYIANAPGYETVECMEDVILYVLKQSVLARLFQEDIHIANGDASLQRQNSCRLKRNSSPCCLLRSRTVRSTAEE